MPKKPKGTFRANCIMVDEWDRRVATVLNHAAYRLRRDSELLTLSVGENTSDALRQEQHSQCEIIIAAAMMIEAMAERTIKRGLPKRYRKIMAAMLCETSKQAAEEE